MNPGHLLTPTFCKIMEDVLQPIKRLCESQSVNNNRRRKNKRTSAPKVPGLLVLELLMCLVTHKRQRK